MISRKLSSGMGKIRCTYFNQLTHLYLKRNVFVINVIISKIIICYNQLKGVTVIAFGAETITLKQAKIVRKFKGNNVISSETATDLNSLDIRKTRTFNNLVKQNVIKQYVDKCYLDIENWMNFRKSFKRWFLISSSTRKQIGTIL